MADFKETTHGNAGNISSLSGAACAWNIAFSDLKRRFWISQNDVLLLKNENQKLNAELHQQKEYIEHLKKENKHLDTLLNSKNASYDKLIVIHNELMKQDHEKHAYNKDLSRQIVQLNEEKQLFQEQFSKAIVDNQHLRNKCDVLQREKKQIENEIEILKNIPEISISETNVTNSKREENKQLEDLLSENKHLKTSIHWLSDELHKLKSDGEIGNTKRVHISGCLEEGFNNQALRLNFPQVTKNMPLLSYIRMLHNTINVLKEQLKLSTKQIKRLLDCKVSNDELTAEENLMIDTNFMENYDAPESDGWEKLESGQIYLENDSGKNSLPLKRELNENSETLSVDNLENDIGKNSLPLKRELNENSETLSADNLENDIGKNLLPLKCELNKNSETLSVDKESEELNSEKIQKENSKAKISSLKDEERSSLYPSLLKNLQKQQTKIYLKENHVLVGQARNSSDGSVQKIDISCPPSRRIWLYEKEN